MPPAEIGTAQQEIPVTYVERLSDDELWTAALTLDSEGNYVFGAAGKFIPLDLDSHVMSYYINTEDPLPEDFYHHPSDADYENSIYDAQLAYEVSTSS